MCLPSVPDGTESPSFDRDACLERYGCSSYNRRSVDGLLFRKINDSSGVDGLAHKQYLKMQVWSGTSSGVATQGNGLSGLDLSSFVQQACLQVSINRLKTVQMTDYHKPAITAIVVSCLAYITSKAEAIVSPTSKQGLCHDASFTTHTINRCDQHISQRHYKAGNMNGIAVRNI